MDPIAEKYPVTSAPCPFYNYFLNVANSWQRCIYQYGISGTLYEEAKSSADRICFAEAYVKNVLKVDLKPKIVFHGKDLREADAARERGNLSFAVGALHEALSLYNSSISFAPWKKDGEDNPCLALSVANRSAVFYRLKRYAECIRDIDQAVIFGYPTEMVKKLLIRKAKAFLALGHPKEAVFVLETEGKILNVCKGAAGEICELGGDMKDYADELSFALRKQKEENESKNGPGAEKRALKTKFSTGYDREAERKKLGLRDGHGVGWPFLSKAVQILQCHDLDGTQRHVSFLAKQNIDAGDVLMVEPAYVSAVHEETVHTNCYACLCWTDAPFPCFQCSVIVFCSPTCATGPKAALHARECKFWETFCLGNEVKEELMTRTVVNYRRLILLALRMILTRSPEEWLARFLGQRVVSDGSLKSKYLGESLAKVSWLMKYGAWKRQNMCESDFNPKIAFIAFYMAKVLETEYFSGVSFTREMHLQLAASIARALVVCDRDLNMVLELYADDYVNLVLSASVLHPLHSVFQRSCEPNTIGVHHGDSMVLRACQPIPKGQLITVPHTFVGYTHLPLKDRQLQLTSVGDKPCECRACKEDWPLMSKMQVDHDKGLCEAKCPTCSCELGTFRALLKRPGILGEGCPRCGASADFLRKNLLDVAREYGLGKKFVEPTASPCFDVPKLLEKVRALRKICVEPCFVLAKADMLLRHGLLMTGNERYDSILQPMNMVR